MLMTFSRHFQNEAKDYILLGHLYLLVHKRFTSIDVTDRSAMVSEYVAFTQIVI
jgi:hypothetical protein